MKRILLRVTNLSKDTREPDLLELLCLFGAVSRVYVAVDQKTGTSRGFGFVNFVNREDAERELSTSLMGMVMTISSSEVNGLLLGKLVISFH